MAARHVRVMTGRLVGAGLVVLRRFAVMMGRLLVVLGGLLVMLGALVRGHCVRL